MGFPRQDYWSRLLFPPPGDLPDLGIEPVSPTSPALQDSLPLSHQGGPDSGIGQGKHKLNLGYWLISESRAVLRATKWWGHLKGTQEGTSLVAQWLRLRASNARGVGLLPGQGTKSPHATWRSQKSIKITEKQNPQRDIRTKLKELPVAEQQSK